MHVRAKSESVSASVPQYRHHKPSGKAVVTLSGRDFYLGPWNSKESKAEYDRLLKEWLASGRSLPVAAETGLTVNELILAYWRHCQEEYRKNGQPTSELACVRSAMGPLKTLHGMKPAAKFGPLALQAVRKHFISRGLCRKTVNDYVSRIKRCFKWATENELVPSSVFHGLQAVSGLKRGRSDARESEPVKPVPEAFIDAVLPKVPLPVRAMIEVQLLTGCRPGEACAMRTCDIDRTGRIWIYRPESHKTEHHEHDREILIGPKTQEIIRPWLRIELTAYLFQPREAETLRNKTRRHNRASPLTPSQSARRPKTNRQRAPRDRYDVASYRRAITRGCEIAFGMPEALRKPPRDEKGKRRGESKEEKAERLRRAKEWRAQHCWHPHQLRHNAATRFRKEYGVELARIVLGHASAFTTEIYAEVDRSQAMVAIAKIG